MKIHNAGQLMLDIAIFLMQFLIVMNGFNGTKLDNLLIQIIPFGCCVIHKFTFRDNCYKYIWLNMFNYFVGSVCQTIWYIEYWQLNTRHRTEFYDTHTFLACIYYIHTLIGIWYYYEEKRKEVTQTSVP
jgi:hypothetical protein